MYELLSSFLLPATLLHVLTALALANLWWRRRETRARLLCLTVPFLLLTLVCFPPCAFLALRTLEGPVPASAALPRRPEVIVVLSGGLYADRSRPDAVELAPDTFYRCRHALELHRLHPCALILVSGGLSDEAPEGPTLADAMRDFLVAQGIKGTQILTESRSGSTYENAVECARLLRERGSMTGIVLVTEAKHMRRAVLCFRKQGVEVTPSACHYEADHFDSRPQEYLPSPAAAVKLGEVFHEWLGLGYYWLRGRV